MAVVLVSATTVACGNSSPNSANGTVNQSANNDASGTRGAVLRDVVSHAIRPSHEAFLESAQNLAAATAAWAETRSDTDRETAQEAWRDAMLKWQVVEVYRFGPAGAMGIDVGGRDLRDAIYSWPTTSECRVDQVVVAQSYEDVATLEQQPVNVRGLDALEFLLFYAEPTNECDQARSINQDGSWAALSGAEIGSRRAAYASTASALIVDATEELIREWDEGFEDEFTNPSSSSMFGSTQEALNTLSNALFYVELDVKDQKIATPAGILNCSTATCPETREFVWTDENFTAIAANLDGFELAFTGGAGRGFDDLLTEIGQQELSEQILARVAEAREAALNATPMTTALASNPDEVADVHVKVKAITDLLKTQFVSVLDLELPQQAEGDND